MVTITPEIRLIDLRPIMNVGREPFMTEAPPAPMRVDLVLAPREARTLRMVMDGFQHRGTPCASGAEAVRLLLRAIAAHMERA